MKVFVKIFVACFLAIFILAYLYYSLAPKIAGMIFKDKIAYAVFDTGSEYTIGIKDKFAVYYDYRLSKLCPGYIKWGSRTKSIDYNKDDFETVKLVIREGCKEKYYYIFTPKRTGRLVITRVVLRDYIGVPLEPAAREEFKNKLEDGSLKEEYKLVVNVREE